ncbi:hypothetical protein ACEWY4_018994 [Coilia grayii]|uniref:Carrier domain-containing protein n=1 Tax=Coilia grayii TaxID=363190 RepID=A0ABD1JG01_9TELE
MDPQQKLLLQCSYRALEDAGIPMEKASGTKTGVYIGLMNKDFELNRVNLPPNEISHWTGSGLAVSIASNRISYTFNLTGPSFTIDCACSSSLVALHLACQGIRQGDCDMALCGGVNCIIEPGIFISLSKAKMISPDGTSKAFSNRADGYGRGEGCGIVLLKPLKRALQDSDHIWGVISKTAVNQDGHSVSPITKPSMIQQEELLRRVYSTEHDLTRVQYIEAHGTGTPVGDPIEASSISNVIAKARPPGSEPLIIGSVKSNIGHTESAAGVAGLIKVLLMMKHETIVPSVFYSEESASIDAGALNIRIPTKVEKWQSSDPAGRVAGINNFGFGGTNAHAVIKQYKNPVVAIDGDREFQYFVLSAASEKSLTMMIEEIIDEVNKDSAESFESLSYTSACRRSHSKHKYRKAFLTSSLTNLKEQLQSALSKNIKPSKLDISLVFVFCGNGLTYRGMCRQLLKQEPIFRQKVEEIETLLQSYRNVTILDKLENDSDEDGDSSRPDIVQPLLFAVQVGIFSLFQHWGIRPDAVLGHSIGEVAAAHCSGLLSLEDAVKVIHYRSALQSKVTGGKMLVVSNMAVSQVLKLLSPYPEKICLAAFNSPQSCTLSGDADAIDKLQETLSNVEGSDALFLRTLDVSSAFHSHRMNPILSQVENSIGRLQQRDTNTELYSTVSGAAVSDGDFCSGKYWAQNIREPVLFESAVRAAAEGKRNVVFVEIGPRRALQRNIIETLGESPDSSNGVCAQYCESYFCTKTVPVVEMNNEGDTNCQLSVIPLKPEAHKLFHKDAVYIVTGGLTGLGFETVRFIAKRGGGNIIILSRRSPTPGMEQEIEAVQKECGAVIDALQCDVSVTEQVQKAIDTIKHTFPIKGVFHSAVVLHDGILEKLDRSLYEKVMKPKVSGALSLHHATKHCNLDYFVCYSSVASFTGNASQSNYAAANSFLDRFCHYRRHLGLAAQSINWGALNVGLLLNKDHLQKFLETRGLMLLQPNEIEQSLQDCLLLNKPQQLICKFNFKNLRRNTSQNASLGLRLASLVKEKVGDSTEPDTATEHPHQSPSEYVRTVLSETLDVKPEELTEGTQLSTLGIDSMLAMTLQNQFSKGRGVTVPLVKFLDPNSTVGTLFKALNQHL